MCEAAKKQKNPQLLSFPSSHCFVFLLPVLWLCGINHCSTAPEKRENRKKQNKFSSISIICERSVRMCIYVCVFVLVLVFPFH